MATMASARFLVQSSCASARRQLHQRTRSIGPACLVAPSGVSTLHTYSRYSQAAPTASLSKDLSVLAALETKTKANTDGGPSIESGWASWEVLASAALAVAATGSFLMGSAMTSPAFSPKMIHRGGGGGSGGGGPSTSPAPLTGKKEEKSQVVAVMEDDEGDSYEVSDTPCLSQRPEPYPKF